METDNLDYRASIESLSDRCEQVAALLGRSQRHRADTLARYATGKRIHGLDEIFSYLIESEKAFAESEGLKKISFLVVRARGDLEIGLEATLAGQPSVVADAMRDMMELELLLNDFRNDPKLIEEWLTCENKIRKNKYSPGEMQEICGKDRR